MSDITQIQVGTTTYDIRDAVARNSLSTKANAADVYTTTQIDTALNLKAPLSSPALTGTPTAPTAADGTNTTQIATTQFVQNAFKANDAMVFKGTIGSSGATVTTLPTTHYQGWTYKVATAGSYVGTTCEVGDMIICVTDGTSANNAHWTVIQTNVDGAVTGPASATNAHVATFNGTSGKIIQDSGFTIGKSVPSDAKFTDTTYENSTTTTAGLMSAADKSKLDGLNASNYTSSSIFPNYESNSEIKTKYRIAKKGYTGSEEQYWYYPIAEFPPTNNSNYASLIISGRLGGWVADNMSYYQALIWNRGGTGIASIDISGTATTENGYFRMTDIVVYKDTETSKETVYLKCRSYFTFDLDLELFQSTANIVYNETYLTTEPSGTLMAQASTTMKRLALVNGKLLMNGVDIDTKYATISHTHGNISNTGAITSDTAVANGDKIIVADASTSSALIRTGITFDGSTATKALTQKGTWETFNNYSLPTASSSTKGGIKVGSNLSMNGEVLNATDTTYTNGNGITISGTTISANFPTSGTPSALGTASNGTSNNVARADHVHAKPTYSKSDVGLGNVTNDAQIAKSIGTAKGDLITFTENAAPTRLGIGSSGQVLKVVDGAPAWSSDNNTDVNVTNTLANTTKYYLTGTSNSSTNTGTQVFDSGIYSTTTSGQLNATTYKVNEQVTLQWNSTDQSLDFVFA